MTLSLWHLADTGIRLTSLQWALGAVSALGFGLSKTGIPGLGILAVALFALALPSRLSVGVVLPLLICGDVVAVLAYRRHAVWSQLRRVFPWAAIGVVLGALTMAHIDDHQIQILIGGILVLLVTVQYWRKQQGDSRSMTDSDGRLRYLWFVVGMGLLAGFTTMVANAAGPIMIMYLLAMNLPKMEFIGTGAWFFFCLNLFKVPFGVQQGLISLHSLGLDIVFAPMVIIGALWGKPILKHIDQSLFENIALILTFAAAVKLLIG